MRSTIIVNVNMFKRERVIYNRERKYLNVNVLQKKTHLSVKNTFEREKTHLNVNV